MKKKYILLILIIVSFLIGCSSNEINNKTNSNIESNNLILGESVDYWNDKMEKIKFNEKYPDYHYELCNDDIFEGITIANYDTTKITPVDGLQEVIEYGNIYGDKKSRDLYVQISIIDEKNDYSVNINLETGKYSDEYGKYFLDQNKDQYIEEKVNMIKEILE